ncbi:Uroporphyrinogen decarboxylase [Sporomusa silvacetica DSM 10669]|uniref:Uroporphyrinogen decarboxylase n=1 Tax=Sporomusa silvacetica DSM 10669 TaxID=1123289 RepID=A0ABZ3IF70_9FIRM|nr:uroporphyrinogen decarboxylase family protein [Sporomusa silvacetica]OZC17943.1 uroporphyrinogen decarboxylase [Sporomusa silvacetica DSM 10669]
MNSKEIFIKAIKLEKTPRVPVTILSGGVWVFNRKGMSLGDSFKLAPQAAAEIIAATNEEVRSDIVWAAAGCNNLAIRAIGGKANFHKVGAASDIAEPLIAKAADVDKLNVDKLKDDAGIQAMLETTKILVKNIGDRTMIGNSQWGPLTLAGLILGTENLMRIMIKDKPAVHAMLEFTSELCYRYWELFVNAGAEFVSMAEPTASGDMIARKQFMEFAMPAATKIRGRIADKVRGTMIHICGDITKFLDLIPEIGVNVVSLDYKVDLAKAREVLHGKIAFTGQMDPVAIMQDETPAGVAVACRECIEKAGLDGGYLMMPGCDLPPGVPLENLKAMVDTAHNYKM